MPTAKPPAPLFLLDTGSGSPGAPPLVLLHGAGGSHRQWAPLSRALPGRRLLALDLPGHGGSPGPACETIDAIAERVLQLLDEASIRAAVLGGHSMGGGVALALALRAPERVAGLLLLGTGARLRVAQSVLGSTADPASLAQAAPSIAGSCFGSSAAAALREEYVASLVAAPPGTVFRDFSACNTFDVMARLGEVRAPALVLCGAEDRMTPPKYSEHLHRSLSGSQLVLIPGAGHMVMLEAPAEVARAATGFLAAL
jgi:pimeloyl-ACP methyl ester carboxylesterase